MNLSKFFFATLRRREYPLVGIRCLGCSPYWSTYPDSIHFCITDETRKLFKLDSEIEEFWFTVTVCEHEFIHHLLSRMFDGYFAPIGGVSTTLDKISSWSRLFKCHIIGSKERGKEYKNAFYHTSNWGYLTRKEFRQKVRKHALTKES